MGTVSPARRVASPGKGKRSPSRGETPSEGRTRRAGSSPSSRPGMQTASQRAARKKEVRRLRDAELLLDEAPLSMVGERAQDALEAMLRALDIRRNASATPKKMQPVWHHVKALVVTANREGLRRAYAAFPAEEGHYFFGKALSTLEYSASTVNTAADGGEFAECPLLLSHLMEATLNNIAFQQYIAHEPPEAILKTLQRALKVQHHQAFRTLTLYNMAVAFLAARRYEDATEFVARCSQVAEVCLELEVSLTREISSLYKEYHTMVATHAIMCHHLLAGLAAWSGESDMEVYHAQLALCCATKFLAEGSALVSRCQQRLTAAKSGNSAAVIAQSDEPPRMQMMTDDLEILASPLFLQFLLETQRMQRIVFPPLKGLQRRKTVVKRGQRLGSGKSSPKSRPRTPASPAAPRINQRSTVTEKKKKRVPTLPSVIQDLRRRGSVQPPTYGLYAPPSHVLPLVVTCVPETAYECYKGLRKDVRGLMCSLGRLHELNAADEMIEPGTLESGCGRSLWKLNDNTAESAPPPGRYLRITDRRLRMLSALVRDLRFEKLLEAAILAQSYWRGILSRRENKHRLPMLQERMRQREAVELIQHAYRNHLATRGPIKEKHELRAHRLLVQRLVVIQRHLRGRQSVVEERNRGLGVIVQLNEAILEARRRVAASIVIQSSWRMCAVRIRILRLLAATIRVQSVWRGHVGRVEARERRVRERLRKQDRLAVLLRHVYPVQKRWRGVLAIRKAKEYVEGLKKNVVAYLEEQERIVDAMWGRFKCVANVELSVLKILDVLRAYRSREECAKMYPSMLTRRRFLLRIVWKKRATHIAGIMREQQLTKWMLQRRREEVADAVLLLQCAVRRWFAQRKSMALRRALDWTHVCARKIQSMYKRQMGRRMFLEAKMATKLREEQRMISQLRHYCASKIQATWRMFTVWHENKDYLHFLHHGRHKYATTIRNAWITYRERQQKKVIIGMRLMEHQQKQSAQEQLLSVLRIQAMVRMFLVRSRMLRDGVQLRPTLAKLHRSARSIQMSWRRHAAYEYVSQLRFSRAYYDQHKVNMESLHTYATMIQSLVRAKVINPWLVAVRELELEQASTEEKERRREKMLKTYALFTKENMFPGAGNRLSACGPEALVAGGRTSLDTGSFVTPLRNTGTSYISEGPCSFSVKLCETCVLPTRSVSRSCLSGTSQSADICAQKGDEHQSLDTTSLHQVDGQRSPSSDQLDVVKSCTANAVHPPLRNMDTRSTTILGSLSAIFSGRPDLEGSADGRRTSAGLRGRETSHSSCPAGSEFASVTTSEYSSSLCYDPVVLAAVVALIQRCGRGFLSRASTRRSLQKSDRWLAAVDIQRMWRGFCARQLVEVYYEFYTEEVEVAAAE
ncbi:uncharacterized protein TEOVI_000513200 [Trypanosoma equiperdum]|nr:conserved protein [Trypanosoma equiperdum]